MATIAVEMYVPINLAPHVVRGSASRVLHSLEEKASPYGSLALAFDFGDLRIAELTNPLRWRCRLEIRAAVKERFFPKFCGTLSAMAVGTQTELWLQGAYEPPLGTFGAAVDATVLRGAAKSALRSFLQWLADEIRNDADAGKKRKD